MRAVGQQFLLEFGEDVLRRGRILRQGLRKECVQGARFDVRKYALLLDMVEVIG